MNIFISLFLYDFAKEVLKVFFDIVFVIICLFLIAIMGKKSKGGGK